MRSNVEYGRDSGQLYGEHALTNEVEVFKEDVLYWTNNYFKVLSYEAASITENIEASTEASIQKRTRINMSTELVHYTNTVRKKVSLGSGRLYSTNRRCKTKNI